MAEMLQRCALIGYASILLWTQLLIVAFLYKGRYAGKIENRIYDTSAGRLEACDPIVANKISDFLKVVKVIIRH